MNFVYTPYRNFLKTNEGSPVIKNFFRERLFKFEFIIPRIHNQNETEENANQAGLKFLD